MSKRSAAARRPAVAAQKAINPTPEPPEPPLRISADALALAGPRPAVLSGNPYAAPVHPPGVGPNGSTSGVQLAFDSSTNDVLSWAAGNQIASAFAEGTVFLGYPLLAALAQRPEYRIVSEIPAYEMTREWIEFETVGEGDKKDKIEAIEAELVKLKAQAAFRAMAISDGTMGRGHLYLDTGSTQDDAELKTPLGNGEDVISKSKIGPRKNGAKKLLALRPVEAMWCYPMQYESSDPLSPDWYKPQSWYVMRREVHHSRLLTLVGRPMPDLLKPSYSFGGLSMSQMCRPYIENWLKIRQAVADLVTSFSVSGIKGLDLQAMLATPQLLMDRLDLFNRLRANKGTMVLGKTEEFFNVTTPLGGLSELQSAALEHIASVSGIPVVKLLGIQPMGLNASSEGEIRSFYDRIKAAQEQLFRPPLTVIINLVQLGLFGEVDPDITFQFKDLWQLDDAGESAVQKTQADTHDAYVAMGAIDGGEVRQWLSRSKRSPYQGLDLSKPLPEPEPEQPEPGEEVSPGPENPDRGAVETTGEQKPNGLMKPRDPGSGLASRITNAAALAGGDMALDGRLNRSVFLYMAPKPPADEFAQCSTCRDRMPASSRCRILDVPITAGSSCGLYVHGRGNDRGAAARAVDPKTAGFVHELVRCEHCEHLGEDGACGFFKTMNELDPELYDLDVKVDRRGCCNAFQPRAVRKAA